MGKEIIIKVLVKFIFADSTSLKVNLAEMSSLLQ